MRVMVTLAGQTMAESTRVPEDYTVRAVLEECYALNPNKVDVFVNNNLVHDLDQELSDGDNIRLMSRKHSSGN